MNIKFDTQALRNIVVFERITGVEVRDCYIDEDTAYFVVDSGKAGLAIGKNGKTINLVQESLNKNVKVYEFSNNIERFIKNIIPRGIKNIKIETTSNGNVVHLIIDKTKRNKVLGKKGINILLLKRFLKRAFGIKDVIVEV